MCTAPHRSIIHMRKWSFLTRPWILKIAADQHPPTNASAPRTSSLLLVIVTVWLGPAPSVFRHATCYLFCPCLRLLSCRQGATSLRLSLSNFSLCVHAARLRHFNSGSGQIAGLQMITDWLLGRTSSGMRVCYIL